MNGSGGELNLSSDGSLDGEEGESFSRFVDKVRGMIIQ